MYIYIYIYIYTYTYIYHIHTHVGMWVSQCLHFDFLRDWQQCPF